MNDKPAACEVQNTKPIHDCYFILILGSATGSALLYLETKVSFLLVIGSSLVWIPAICTPQAKSSYTNTAMRSICPATRSMAGWSSTEYSQPWHTVIHRCFARHFDWYECWNDLRYWLTQNALSSGPPFYTFYESVHRFFFVWMCQVYHILQR